MERRDPVYPVEGIRQGILRTVVVKARLTIDARGTVTDVVILEGGPIAAFGRQTRLTLRDWKFNPGVPGRSIDIEVTFKP
jgi:protein TonB